MSRKLARAWAIFRFPAPKFAVEPPIKGGRQQQARSSIEWIRAPEHTLGGAHSARCAVLSCAGFGVLEVLMRSAAERVGISSIGSAAKFGTWAEKRAPRAKFRLKRLLRGQATACSLLATSFTEL